MKRLASIFTLLIKRWVSKTPKRAKYSFWVSLIVLVGSIAVMNVFSVPVWVYSILEMLSIISSAIALDSKFQTDDKNLVKETEKVKQTFQDKYRKSFFGNIFKRRSKKKNKTLDK